MRRRALVIALLLAGLGCGGAAAPPAGGWGFAHWGMSKAAVRTALNGRAHAPKDDMDDPDDVVDGGATIDGYKFSVAFEYDASGLAQIDFRLLGTAADCKALGAYLKETYGAQWTEETSAAADTLIWNDPASGNSVSWSRMGDGEGCEVTYAPVTTTTEPR